MATKKYSKNGRTCQVTFQVPKELDAQSANLCGEFNDWDTTSHPMSRTRDGRFKLMVRLEPGRSYRYRFLLDGNRWENDWEADRYEPNEYGSDDSVIEL